MLWSVADLPREEHAISMGACVGSWLAGFTFDVTGSYRVAFALSVFFYACGSVAFWMLRSRGSSQLIDHNRLGNW